MRRRSVTMLLLTVATLAGCGGSVAPRARSGSSVSVPASRPAKLAALTSLPLHDLQNDREDDDEAGEAIGVDPKDSDDDGDNDRARLWGFYDHDDSSVADWGTEAAGSRRDVLILFARRYYGLAAADQGAGACAMLTATAVRTLPQDFGHGSAGPRYLSSATNCPQLLTLFFAHQHAQLSGPIEVLRTRVKGREALVLVGSKVAPASYFELIREHGAWRSTAMIAYPLV